MYEAIYHIPMYYSDVKVDMHYYTMAMYVDWDTSYITIMRIPRDLEGVGSEDRKENSACVVCKLCPFSLIAH